MTGIRRPDKSDKLKPSSVYREFSFKLHTLLSTEFNLLLYTYGMVWSIDLLQPLIMDVLIDLTGDRCSHNAAAAAEHTRESRDLNTVTLTATHPQALRLEQMSCLGRTPPAIAPMGTRYMDQDLESNALLFFLHMAS